MSALGQKRTSELKWPATLEDVTGMPLSTVTLRSAIKGPSSYKRCHAGWGWF